MILPLQFQIKSNPNLYRYLRENSYWYKDLNRNPNNLRYMEEEMREHYQLRPSDKISKLVDQLNLIRTFMDMIE